MISRSSRDGASSPDRASIDRHYPLCDDEREGRDACGVGFVATLDGRANHDVLRKALFALRSMAHRGAVDASGETGDGAGIMMGVPREFFASWLHEASRGDAAREDRVAVGALFLPELGRREYGRAKTLVEDVLEEHGLGVWAWRYVPFDRRRLGAAAREAMPEIEQIVISVGAWGEVSGDEIERRLYAIRIEIARRAREVQLAIYVCSLSCRTIVYKGLVTSRMLREFYDDLRDPRFVTSFAMFHQRFSTNTLPSWHLAQPFCHVAHNGEINTVRGNISWAEARASASAAIGGELFGERASDSAHLDTAIAHLAHGTRSLPHVVSMLIPAATNTIERGTDAMRAFYDYHACVTQPWDGPASIVFSDGKVVGAALDRNGLRPARFKITCDKMIVVSSEVGVLALPDERFTSRERLGPGQMLVVNLERGGAMYHDEDIKHELSQARPWRTWLDHHQTRLERTEERDETIAELLPSEPAIGALHNVFGYSSEEFRFVFEPMAHEGHEPVSSMGDDTPLAALAEMPRLPCTYLRQQFAQVTNPPIDSIREAMVMDLRVFIGPMLDWHEQRPEHAAKVVLPHPVLTATEEQALRHAVGEQACAVLDATWSAEAAPDQLADAIRALCERAERAVDEGASLLVICDRGVSAERAPIPILLAVGAVHQHLLRCHKRTRTSLIVRTGEAREVHHVATLLGFGASAVHAWLAEATIAQGEGSEAPPTSEAIARIERWRDVLHKGLLKVMAKMGISTLTSYHGGQLFEAVGLDPEVVSMCFARAPAHVQGVDFAQLGRECLARHERGTRDKRPESVDDWGGFRYRRSGEDHGWTPAMLRAIKKFREQPAQRDEHFAAYLEALDARPPISLRDLMEYVPTEAPLDLSQVEPARAIARRFTTAAMSLGSLSPEAHRMLTTAMNRLGAASNTGEGGEDPDYYKDPDSRELIASIKQIASGRFGVTPEYLMRAKEIEIKMAQGSKPGEGGQIPGHKVTDLIARIRRATLGVALISPPPHHDIYSIEDLAQLIWDLKQLNPRARVCVKLVAEAGVGTIAAGVAKAGADTILISGHDGGTGASPLSSIKNAGSPWEIGLAQVQQMLVMNGLRDRVRLRTDGGLRSGRDVVIAAALGAEEYNFGTAALVALGCRYVRQCHSNTCPVGVATQREDLRARYDGDADQLASFLLALAEDVRGHLAKLGVPTLDALIGRTDRLRQRALPEHLKASRIDISPLIAPPYPGAALRHDPDVSEALAPREITLNDRIMADVSDDLRARVPVVKRYIIRNTDRSVGARLAGQIALNSGPVLAPGSVHLDFHGSAGQSFGAFTTHGMRLRLTGEANDFVAKGMHGGEIIIRSDNLHEAGPVLLGNTTLYGATGGELYVAGCAGERFAVRNSGARAVVEGVGMHGCEYMTGGVVLVLGSTGYNFAAGMTGGVAYVFDVTDDFIGRHSASDVFVQRVHHPSDVAQIAEMVRRHAQYTRSPLACALAPVIEESGGGFWKVTPIASSQHDALPGDRHVA